MDVPFPSVPSDGPIDDAFELLLRGEAAVMVLSGSEPVAVITRADLLEYVARQGRT
jgi:predicted transcriptional regulator